MSMSFNEHRARIVNGILQDNVSHLMSELARAVVELETANARIAELEAKYEPKQAKPADAPAAPVAASN